VSFIAWIGVEDGPNCRGNRGERKTQCGSVGMRASSSVFVARLAPWMEWWLQKVKREHVWIAARSLRK
jgi:hypothetical protein